MKFFIFLNFFFAFFIINNSFAGIDPEKPVKDILKDARIQVDALIGTAVKGGDYLMEKEARQLSLVLDNINTMLSNQQETLFKNLDKSMQNVFTNMDQISADISNDIDKVLDLEQFAFMDFDNVLNRFPSIIQQKFSLRKIIGYSQTFQDKGYYTYILRGNAFNNKYKIIIKLNNKVIATNKLNFVNNTGDNHVTFDVPVNELNQNFKDTDVYRIPIEIIVLDTAENKSLKKLFKKYKHNIIFTTSDYLLLLPKYPVRYTLQEIYTISGWSDERIAITSTTKCPATGEEGKFVQTRVEVTIPSGTKYAGSGNWWTNATPPDGFHGDWLENSVQSNDEKTFYRTFSHGIHDQERVLDIKVYYKNPIRVPQEKYPELNESHLHKYLEYGVHYVDFEPGYVTYTLKLDYFNGKRDVVVPGTKPSCAGLTCKLNTNGNRFSITVNNQ